MADSNPENQNSDNKNEPTTNTDESKLSQNEQILQEEIQKIENQLESKKLEKEQAQQQKQQLEKHISDLKNKFNDILLKSNLDPEYFKNGEESSIQRTVTVRSPMNIALVKYWGKRDVNLNLPLNSSLSATLDPGIMFSETTVVTSKSFERDEISLNGSKFEPI